LFDKTSKGCNFSAVCRRLYAGTSVVLLLLSRTCTTLRSLKHCYTMIDTSAFLLAVVTYDCSSDDVILFRRPTDKCGMP